MQLAYLYVISSISTGLLSLIHISLAALVTLYTAKTSLPSTLEVIIPVCFCFVLFDLILYVPSTIFQL